MCHLVKFQGGKSKLGPSVLYGKETDILQGGSQRKVRGGNMSNAKLHIQSYSIKHISVRLKGNGIIFDMVVGLHVR